MSLKYSGWGKKNPTVAGVKGKGKHTAQGFYLKLPRSFIEEPDKVTVYL